VRYGSIVLVGLVGISGAQRPIAAPRDLLTTMRARYEGKWYRNLTFLQKNTEHRDTAVRHSVWREWIEAPGKLRIEFQPSDSGNGVLFANDSVYSFQADAQAPARPFVHPLLVLAFDVYAQPVERTASQLTQRGFDLSVLSEATWEGRPVWVVGAKAGDLHTRQFWVDKERLVFVRLLEPGRGADSAKTSETRFNKYSPLAGGWISAEVEFLVDGRQQFLEEYSEIRANVPFPDGLFDPRRWKAARGTNR
jgi:hypothetical protein